MSEAIRIESLCKTFEKGNVQAINEISFTVSPGEIFGLIGPDGAGKTTLFRILCTLLLPDSGSASIDGKDIVKDLWKIRRILGYMPGKFSLYQDLSVEENLQFFATVFGTSIRENYHLIKDIYIQLQPFKNRPAGKLSGGMKQKLALCCALVHEPTVLILDEPTTGVDPVSRREFWNMLKKLKQKGITILVSTPYMDEASQCDRIALIQNGQIMDLDDYSKILARHHQQTLAVRGKKMYQLLLDLRAYPGTLSCYAFGDSHHLTLKKEARDITALQQYLSANGHLDTVIQEIEPDIEDVFMHLSNR